MYVYIIFCTVYRVILRTLYFSRLTEHSRDVKRTSRGYHIYRILEVLERPREGETEREIVPTIILKSILGICLMYQKFWRRDLASSG